MRCPFCNEDNTKVVDSRPSDENNLIRRRRQCEACGKRFTTYEKIETIPLVIIKKDKTREPYNRNKLMNGVVRSCHKRSVSMSEIEGLVDEIENSLYNSLKKEIKSKDIGEKVMEKLKTIDEVAYVRFASIYREFKDINTFMDELKKILNDK
ncbi:MULTISPECIES: transcriptional regulator NrdR [Vallitalea]|uniref:Transcriptional repressor NrdR n=2 Tax=Vallitalea TaxID=1348611 RepID=A0A8J8MEF2_9FIRM|nr:transcriptional regulator NrdR [Vallitalea guaymasensis]QUH31426.1 transcriptional repressor NrdR [Vallitalea guaymasensis]GMQ65050.1 transcriptional regulator NrdR [Vallitalea sp. AN17-2]